jgi:outer membrane protein assembly factor BamB
MYQSALCGVDVSTGKLRWSQNIPTRDFDQVGNRIAVVDSLSPREIRLMDPDTGDTVNRVAWSGENDIREVDGLPDALLVHDRRQLACFDALTGTQRWIIPYTGSYSSSGQSVFTAPGRSEIYAAAPEPGSYFFHLQRLDSHTGQELWRTEQLQGGEVHAAVASDGAALLWDNGSRLLQVLDAESGEKRWGFPLKGDGIRIATHGQGVATGARGVETAYVISSDYAQTFAGSQPFFGSVLVALNLNTGQERWRIGSPKRELYGPPVLTSEGGLIFVEGKNVVCLEAQ